MNICVNENRCGTTSAVEFAHAEPLSDTAWFLFAGGPMVAECWDDAEWDDPADLGYSPGEYDPWTLSTPLGHTLAEVAADIARCEHEAEVSRARALRIRAWLDQRRARSA